MYYSVRAWDAQNLLEEQDTVLVEELPALFKTMDEKYPEGKGYEVRVLCILETFQGINREDFREAAERGDPDEMERLFSDATEEFL